MLCEFTVFHYWLFQMRLNPRESTESTSYICLGVMGNFVISFLFNTTADKAKTVE